MHLLRQGEVIRSLIGTLVGAKGTRTNAGRQEATIQPRHPSLIRDYVREVGGDPRSYRDTLPPHLFPQWLFPLQSKCLVGSPYPLKSALNGGGSFTLSAPLPATEPLLASAEVANVDDNGKRAILTIRATTGPMNDPERLTAMLDVFVPLARSPKTKRAHPTIPRDAQEVRRFRWSAAKARRFVALTGDINPIHWLPLAARGAGFRNVILHGYSTAAHAYETIVREIFARDATRVTAFSFRFTRPVVLPAKLSLFVDRRAKAWWIGKGTGDRPYASGAYDERS
ncbi:MAG: MaoC/PaaZ C-terminal domain-containing protein [Polyangiales bacterium]